MSENLQPIRGFLDSIGFEKRRAEPEPRKQYPFIAISRQAAAGGHSLANAILAEMKSHEEDNLFEGWQLFDQEICHMVAQDKGLRVNLRSLVEEEFYSRIEAYLKEVLMDETPQDVVHRKVMEVVKSVASLGKVIILGRGGTCLTREIPGGIHIRLVAPVETRLKRYKKLIGEDEQKAARERMKKHDTARAKFIKTYFGRDIDDPLLYDMVWNTETFSAEEMARCVVALVRNRARFLKDV